MKIKYLRLAPEELSTCQTEAAHVQGWHPSKNCAAIIIRVLSSGDNAPLQTERNCCFPLKSTQPNPEVLGQVLPLDGASTLGAQCCDCDCHVCVGTGGNCPCLHHLRFLTSIHPIFECTHTQETQQHNLGKWVLCLHAPVKLTDYL